MMYSKYRILILLVFLTISSVVSAGTVLESSWNDVIRGNCSDQGSGWWSSAEAIRIAENVLLYQKEIGGWEKNINMQLVLSESEKNSLRSSQSSNGGCTIDNGAVSYELTYLSKVYAALSESQIKSDIKDAFIRGVEYLIEMQYDNGGWPQFYPLRGGYSNHITYNDDAMIHVMKILRHIYSKDSEYAIKADDALAAEAKAAFDKGLECILKTQYIQDGVLTVWCAQHDEETLQPAIARSYELASLSGSESAGILEFLMSITNPSDEIKRAIYSGAKWFEKSKLTGIRLEKFTNSDGLSDLRVVEASASSVLWARFYDLETNLPFFCDRDGIPKSTLAEIGHERRNGYSWYVNSGNRVSSDYYNWVRKSGTTVVASPIPGQVITTAYDTIHVRGYANQFKGSPLSSFELSFDEEVVAHYTTTNIDTMFVGLDTGTYSISVKATYEDGSIESDEVSFQVLPPSFYLEVRLGEGSGDYYENTVVGIEAITAPEGKIFDAWVGDTTYVNNTKSSNTTVTIPSQRIRVTATFKTGPALGAHDQLASFFKIYPNPASNYITIDLAGYSSGKVEIYNMAGKCLLNDFIYQSNPTMNINSLSPGQYLIRLSTEKHVSTQRFIIN